MRLEVRRYSEAPSGQAADVSVGCRPVQSRPEPLKILTNVNFRSDEVVVGILHAENFTGIFSGNVVASKNSGAGSYAGTFSLFMSRRSFHSSFQVDHTQNLSTLQE